MSTTNTPWQDWIPGVLSKKQVHELCENGLIIGTKDEPSLYDYSSMDLTLGNEGYCLRKGAIKPQGEYCHFLASEKNLVQRVSFENDGSIVLEKRTTYVFKLEQRLSTRLKSYDVIFGQATARSSVGRLDVLARLIVDGMDRYEGFIPSKIASGDMFLEITPLTFKVCVRPGIPLSQLRLFYGNPEHSLMKGEELYKTVLPNPENQVHEQDGCLTLDLSDSKVGNSFGATFQAEDNEEPIPIWKADPKPDPTKYWTLKSAEQIGLQKRLAIESGKFYILRSKQKIALTKNVAAYCRATDETLGEMRIHYAGFVHPFFGRERKDGVKGTPLIFEVRGHDVKVALNDGEKMAQLDFYRMSEDCVEEPGSGAYADQSLRLSSIFDEWKK